MDQLNIEDFLERDKALCSQALDGDRDVLLRAAEMIGSKVHRVDGVDPAAQIGST